VSDCCQVQDPRVVVVVVVVVVAAAFGRLRRRREWEQSYCKIKVVETDNRKKTKK
jgi:hypothetical protein